MIDFPDGTARRQQERWREKVADAQRQYAERRDRETRAEYLRVLKVFTDLVLRSKTPTE